MFHVVNKHTPAQLTTVLRPLMAILINANQALKRFKREVEFTEIKHGELTSGEFSQPQSKRKKN